MTARVLCAVLLCLSRCLSSTEAATELNTAVNPGVCPRKIYTAEECKIRFVRCANDSDCAKTEKCCHNGCGPQCMAPVPVKPGVCPSGKIEPAVCAVTRFRWMCDYDSDCAKNEKCCNNGCVLQCMAPATVNPGVCPSRRYTAEECTWIRFVSCADDSNCAKNEKCCSNGCGLQCMAPVTVKPGVCPSKRYTPKECDMIRYVMAPKTCTDDSDCVKKNEKCCSNGCIRQCTAPAPAPVKPGVCPSKRYTPKECDMIRYVMAPKTCTDDSDCVKNEKCCSNGCIRQCTAQVTV